MEKLFAKLSYLCFKLCFEIKSYLNKTKRFIWDRNIIHQWNRLWISKNEFHSSLIIDINAMPDMSPKQRDAYIADLYKRRQIAHDRDLIN